VPSIVDDQVPAVTVPVLVKLELVTPDPRAVDDSTLVPLILYAMPLRRLRCVLDVQADVEETQLNV
jgi:hypothetical protein